MLRISYSDHFLSVFQSVFRPLTLSNDNFSKAIEAIRP